MIVRRWLFLVMRRWVGEGRWLYGFSVNRRRVRVVCCRVRRVIVRWVSCRLLSCRIVPWRWCLLCVHFVELDLLTAFEMAWRQGVLLPLFHIRCSRVGLWCSLCLLWLWWSLRYSLTHAVLLAPFLLMFEFGGFAFLMMLAMAARAFSAAAWLGWSLKASSHPVISSVVGMCFGVGAKLSPLSSTVRWSSVSWCEERFITQFLLFFFWMVTVPLFVSCAEVVHLFSLFVSRTLKGSFSCGICHSGDCFVVMFVEASAKS